MMTKHFSHGGRDGLTLIELLVAVTLSIAGLAIVSQGTLQTKRLMQDIRCYQLATDELANQLERLTAMKRKVREQALSQLQPSVAIRSILKDVKLRADEISDADGERIRISIQWDRRGPSVPLVLEGWILADDLSEQTLGDTQ
jgi:hypothetical protein